MSRLTRLCFLLIFGAAMSKLSLAQLPYDDAICPQKDPRKLKNDELCKKMMNGLNRSFIYLSYLHYSDRNVDRPLTGPDEFEPFRGKIIRNVDVSVIEPYGVSIDKPVADHYTNFQKFANKVQLKTKQWVVRNDLLFKPGERINPVIFADTERDLWEEGNYKDLKIFITPVDGSDELVDVIVVVQDKWCWEIDTYASYDKVSTGLGFRNFLGLPQHISADVAFNYRRDNFYTVSGHYSYHNIAKSHIDVSIKGRYENLSQGGKLDISRDFFSANSKWAGHIQAAIYHEAAKVPNTLGDAIPTNVTYNWQDFWLAGSFKLPGKLGEKYELLRAIVSARMRRYQYMDRPFERSPDGTQLFYNRTYFLGSVAFANWDYYVDHSVYGLDQAEYFSKGFSPMLVTGFDYDEELNKRFYTGLQMSYGKYINRVGYINSQFVYGAYLRKKTYEQVLFRVSNQFYSAPVKLGRKFMFRQFITTNFNFGFNRPSDRELVTNNDNGVRGIFVNYVRGTRNYVFNFETDVYPNFRVLGFSSSVFMFADIAITQQNSFKDCFLTQGYGVGLKLRNLNLGIDYFSITFAYYPSLNIPGLKPYSVIAGFESNKTLDARNAFEPLNLTQDDAFGQK